MDAPTVDHIFENFKSIDGERILLPSFCCMKYTNYYHYPYRCSHHIDPDKYIRNCMFDTCSCNDGESCLCDAIASYVHDCANKGVVINWRNEGYFPACGMTILILFILAILSCEEITEFLIKLYIIWIPTVFSPGKTILHYV